MEDILVSLSVWQAQLLCSEAVVDEHIMQKNVVLRNEEKMFHVQ